MAGIPATADLRPPVSQIKALDWLRANLFTSWANTALTLVVGYVIVRTLMGFIP